jgi:broad specificity phosphatase PhoE
MKTGKGDNNRHPHRGLHLANEYFIMRHGQSEANIGRFICSSPADGLDSCGLTPEGVRQAREAALNFFPTIRRAVVYSSDFLRARQTAATVAECIRPNRVELTPLLRERFFGEFDRGDDRLYAEVWKADRGNPDNEAAGVESPAAVRKRALAAIRACEREFSGSTILLVSHGDILQILFATFLGLSPDRHREIIPITNAEIRRLVPSEGLHLEELE